MNIVELIDTLQQLRNKYGDKEVRVWTLVEEESFEIHNGDITPNFLDGDIYDEIPNYEIILDNRKEKK